MCIHMYIFAWCNSVLFALILKPVIAVSSVRVVRGPFSEIKCKLNPPEMQDIRPWGEARCFTCLMVADFAWSCRRWSRSRACYNLKCAPFDAGF